MLTKSIEICVFGEHGLGRTRDVFIGKPTMQMTRGKVPHFSMRPHPMVSGGLISILVVGLLLAMSFFAKEEGTGQYKQQGILTLIIMTVSSILLIILATSKFWFPHLWKKNSTHARHKQHTKHHPAVKERKSRSHR